MAVIHIAGTNGKGSVAMKIAKVLELMDLRVGLFCSPHVSSFRERMQMNGQLISEEEVVQLLPELYALCETYDIPATFFEITTALAFLFYQKHKVDVVVLETGLGGRLDSTNVVKSPVCAVITSIGLEHTRILGDTIEKIALEKGGIIKLGRPVLVGPRCPQKVLRDCATGRGASAFYTIGDLLEDEAAGTTCTSTSAQQPFYHFLDYDEENTRIATAALRLVEKEKRIANLNRAIPDDIMQQGTSRRPPCRFELVERDDGVSVVLDVAHNPPALQYLVQKLKLTFPERRFRIIAGISSDKNLELCGQYLLEAVEKKSHALHLVQASHPRAAKLEDILSADSTGLLEKTHFDLSDRSVTKQISLGLDMANQGDEVLVICGSVFLMAEAREALGFEEPRDSEYIAELAGAHLRHGQEHFSK